jgi:hypothetical protein
MNHNVDLWRTTFEVGFLLPAQHFMRMEDLSVITPPDTCITAKYETFESLFNMKWITIAELCQLA